jgi:peptidoglycan/LPS O-acetylase OafA/YrhL
MPLDSGADRHGHRVLRHIGELDGLRGLAALWVYLLHTLLEPRAVNGTAPLSMGWKIYTWICSGGSYGVDIFFVLSGFLITSLLLLDRENPNYFHDFYWKRALRILPVFMLYLVAVWFSTPYGHGYVLLSLLFVVNFDVLLRVVDAGPAWTLAIEEQFYLLWPQAVRRMSLRSISILALLLGTLGLLLPILQVAALHHVVVRYTWNRVGGLGLGALLACQRIEKQSMPGWIRQCVAGLNSRPALLLCVALGLLAVVPVTLPPYLLTPAIAVTSFLTYRFILYVLQHPGSHGLRWMRSRPMRWLGDISYSLYLFHTIVLILWDKFLPPVGLVLLPFLLRLAGISAVTVAICLLLRYFVELPAQTLRRFVLRRSRKQADASP